MERITIRFKAFINLRVVSVDCDIRFGRCTFSVAYLLAAHRGQTPQPFRGVRRRGGGLADCSLRAFLRLDARDWG